MVFMSEDKLKSFLCPELRLKGKNCYQRVFFLIDASYNCNYKLIPTKIAVHSKLQSKFTKILPRLNE